MTITRSIVLFVLLFSTAQAFAQTSPSTASADNASRLTEMRTAVLHADYPTAVELGTQLLARSTLSPRTRNQILETLAIAHLALQETPAADQVLEELYRRDPEHRLSDDNVSPSVQAAFQRAHSRRRGVVTVRIVDETGTPTTHGSPRIRLTLPEGRDAVDHVVVHYQSMRFPTFAEQRLSVVGPSLETRLPLAGTPMEAETLEYFITAHAPSGAVLMQLGDENRPTSIVVPAMDPEIREVPLTSLGLPPSRTEVAEASSKGWIVGVVVAVLAAAGAGVAIYFLTRPEQGPDGSLGNLQLTR